MESYEYIESGILLNLNDKESLKKFKHSAKDFAKHGEAFKVVFSYMALKGIGDIKRMNLFYPPEMFNANVYSAYMESWEQAFFAVDKTTGEDVVSSEKGKTTAQQRVPDVIQSSIRCIE